MNWSTQQRRWRQGSVLAGIATLIVGVLVMLNANPVAAAIELAYFRATSTESAVQLEWATVREMNVSGFKISCKKAGEPDTAYHPIGSRIAQGNSDTGATYTFNVTTGLTRGQAYCFRITEVTTDEFPGERFDLCGYGLGITPDGKVGLVPAGGDATPTPTVIPLEPPPGLEPAPPLEPASPLPTPTETPFQPESPFQPQSPLTDAQAQETAAAQQAESGQPVDTQPDVLIEPAPTETPTEFPTPTETPTEFPTEIPTEIPTETPTPTPLETVAEPDEGAVALLATPTPIYIVVTATPDQESAALIAPAYTPWPTATPTPASQGIADLLVLNTQNLMVMLLCLIFLSASGLGALGLVTSILYMRSQTRRERYLPPPPYGRRRY